MLKKLVQLLRLTCNIDHERKKKKRHWRPSIEKEYEGWEGRNSISLDFNSQSENISVRIVHPGGRRERFRNAVLASDVMKKYPGMFIARPEVFKYPHESLLKQEEYLLPGQKYYMVPSSTAKKLKRKHPAKVKAREYTEGKDVLDEKIMNPGGERLVESDCCAKEVNLSRERWAKSLMRKGIKGKNPFVPPFPKARSCKRVGWEPSLTSIQELSP